MLVIHRTSNKINLYPTSVIWIEAIRIWQQNRNSAMYCGIIKMTLIRRSRTRAIFWPKVQYSQHFISIYLSISSLSYRFFFWNYNFSKFPLRTKQFWVRKITFRIKISQQQTKKKTRIRCYLFYFIAKFVFFSNCVIVLLPYAGAFLLTPSHELSMERAALICEKMNFKGCFSLTKTATGILFKFSHPEDYQAVYKKGFHKVTGARFYRKVPVPCRPQKTFTLFVFDVPDDIPIEDVRHSLYRFNSVVEVVRLVIHNPNEISQGKCYRSIEAIRCAWRLVASFA